MPNLVLIIGPQAVGKMTVGQELAKDTGYTLFHNHMTIELALALFKYDINVWQRINKEFRNMIFEEFSKSDQPGIIFTYCFDFGKHYESEIKTIKYWMSFFEKTYVIELEADIEERLRRNETENRLNNKPSKRNLEWSKNDIIDSFINCKLNSENGEAELIFDNYIKINNTNLLPEEVCKIVKEHFNL